MWILLCCLSACIFCIDMKTTPKAMLVVVLNALLRVLTYCLVLLAGGWCWFQWSHRDLIRAAANVSCTLKKYPIFGHSLYTLHGMDEVTRYAINMSTDAVAKGIYTICFWCGPLPIIMVHGMEDIQKILNSSATSEKGDEMYYIKHAIGDGLLTAPGDIWKVTRRHINPLFHSRNVEQLTSTFNQNSRELVTVLSEHVGRGPVNVMDHTMDVALKTICHLIFGTDVEFDMKSTAFQNLKKTVEHFPALFIKRVLRLWLRSDIIFEFLYRKELKEINDGWKEFTEAPLKITRAKNALKKPKKGLLNEGSPIQTTDDTSEGPLNLVDVYTVLQKNYPQFSERELLYEMMTLYATGTDTVGAAVSTCLLVLAQYKDIQERLYNEISSVVSLEGEVTQEDLNRMPYLDQVYKETLRWSTIVPYILRKPSVDIKLSSCTIPKGNTIIVGLMGIHLDPKRYPDPHSFDPERFSSEKTSESERYSFLPFSGGPRNCIGKVYSQLLVKTMLVHVLRRFRLSTTMDIHTMKRSLVVTLVSSEGYNVTLENRT